MRLFQQQAAAHSERRSFDCVATIDEIFAHDDSTSDEVLFLCVTLQFPIGVIGKLSNRVNENMASGTCCVFNSPISQSPNSPIPITAVRTSSLLLQSTSASRCMHT